MVMRTQDAAAVANPPLAESYKRQTPSSTLHIDETPRLMIAECELPVIDLRGLRSRSGAERRACARAIAEASSEWGFFQVLHHGISNELFSEMKREQIKLFDLPFEKKASSRLLSDSYRWGTPMATSPQQFSWSEALHVPLAKTAEDGSLHGEFNSLRYIQFINSTECSKQINENLLLINQFSRMI